MVILRSSMRIFQSKEKLVVMKVGVEVGVEEEEGGGTFEVGFGWEETKLDFQSRGSISAPTS